MKNMKKLFVFIVITLVVGGVIFGIKKFFFDGENGVGNILTPKKEEKKLKIFDEDSNSRVVAVMINNNHDAWPHAGLQDSFLNYEIIAEGGITRIMSLFKDKLPDKIGSVRSSRPYFLDYVMENDAIYAHFGGSDQAYSDMSSYGIDHIDGIIYDGVYYYRDLEDYTYYEHTAFTTNSMLNEAISDLDIRTASDKGMVFNYSVNNVNLSKREDAIPASSVTIDYSDYTSTSYTYDEENKVYLRSMSGIPHTDKVTGKQYTAKNIITYKVKNTTIDYYGRQALDNIGSGEGYFITNGYAVPITWEKTGRKSKTVYKYKATGKEIKLNDGNTWVQIQPEDKFLDIVGNNIPENE